MGLRGLPWVADGVDGSEKEAAELLIGAARWYPEVYFALAKMPWVRDGITQAETDAIYGLRWTSYYSILIARQMLALSWAQDGITAAEGRAMRYLYFGVRYTRPLAEGLLEKPWIHDGITADEATVVQNLYWMARTDDEDRAEELLETAVHILDMPFLEAVEGPDAQAVQSLRRLERADWERFQEKISHPKLDDGITDAEAKMVALLGGTYSYRPESGDVLLRGAGVHWEEMTAELPLAGPVELAVVRIRDQSTASMDYLEHSVRTIEEFMGVPMPATYIALLYDDAVFPGSGGTNFGTHMAMQLLYDVENSVWWEYTPFVIAHEVAHYYWRGNQDWVDEGAAEILGSISEFAREETQIGVTNYPCAAAETIRELEAMDPEALGTRGFNCNYALGERLFLDLYHALGDEAFRKAFRDLYLKSQAEDYSDDCEGTALGICHVVAAFKADVSEADAAKVDEIIERWYGPVP